MSEDNQINLLQARDDLQSVISALHTCVSALNNKENSEYDSQQIASTLFFIIIPFIRKIEKNLDERDIEG